MISILLFDHPGTFDDSSLPVLFQRPVPAQLVS